MVYGPITPDPDSGGVPEFTSGGMLEETSQGGGGGAPTARDQRHTGRARNGRHDEDELGITWNYVVVCSCVQIELRFLQFIHVSPDSCKQSPESKKAPLEHPSPLTRSHAVCTASVSDHQRPRSTSKR